MQIIRPYGQSRTLDHERKLLDKDKNIHDIPTFSQQHDELIIAHWVSVIDKIARKPKQGKRGKTQGKAEEVTAATQIQYDLRETLHHAAWEVVKTKLPHCDEKRQQYLDALWRFKIHPYGGDRPAQTAVSPEDTTTQARQDAENAKGRWYKRFVGDIEPQDITPDVANVIVARISQHLYHKVPAQAKSIRDNVLEQHRIEQDWIASDQAEYVDVDVAAAIYQTASERVDAAKKAKLNKQPLQSEHHVRLELAGKYLFDHWTKIFLNPEDGTVMTVTQAKAKKPGVFALHQAVKDCYTRLLKHTNKRGDALLRTLPADMTKLYELVGNKQQNRDLAGLVQLGKVLYYRDAENETAPLENSRFWGSDGQAEIKRAEAFVRVWRHVIGQAKLTLESWALMKQANPLPNTPSKFPRDILGSSRTHTLVNHPDNFDADLFDANIALVFGNDAELFTVDDELRKATLESAITGMIALRNTAFHFKGRDKFLAALEQELPDSITDATVSAKIAELGSRAAEKRTQRLLATLQGAHVLNYCKQEQVQQLVNVLSADNSSHLPLPRFSRVLERHGNIQERDGSGQIKRDRYAPTPLPPTANRLDLEQKPAQKCQYIALKLLYERAFRPWLENDSTSAELERWITDALKRTSNKAKSMNAQDGKDKRLLVNARAEKLPRPQKGEDIRDFFFNLSAATASEMRVQRGYESDATAAREQAAYIDELLCDVVALAFQDFLKFNRLSWILDLGHDTKLPETLCCPTDNIRPPQSDLPPQPWQQVLYFLLHLMPVGEVSQLLHQLAKWEITARKGQTLSSEEKQRLDTLQYTLKLYLDMHDSQYTSTESEGKSMPKVELDTLSAFIDFYEHRHVFDLAFPEQGDGRSTEQYLPQRGLREIRRFGHIPVLKTLVGNNKITAGTMNTCLHAEKVPEGKQLSAVATAQQQRETLHSQWIKAKHGFASYREYASALQQVIKHRHAANQSRLVDHVAAHRITMKILARLADFSGLFERDITFVTLALLHESRLQPSDLFTVKGLDKFNNGQILEALTGNDCTNAPHQNLLDELERHLAYKRNKNIRNALAHFNMLQSQHGQLNTPLNLTDWINQTRELMAYDRKLKNAVTKAVQELLEREGFDLFWQMDSSHKLYDAKLKSRAANHLGGKKLPLKGDGKKSIFITESLHSNELAVMLAGAFGGNAKPNTDITTLDFDRVEWEKKRENRQETGYTTAAQRPSKPINFSGQRR